VRSHYPSAPSTFVLPVVVPTPPLKMGNVFPTPRPPNNSLKIETIIRRGPPGRGSSAPERAMPLSNPPRAPLRPPTEVESAVGPVPRHKFGGGGPLALVKPEKQRTTSPDLPKANYGPPSLWSTSQHGGADENPCPHCWQSGKRIEWLCGHHCPQDLIDSRPPIPTWGRWPAYHRGPLSGVRPPHPLVSSHSGVFPVTKK